MNFLKNPLLIIKFSDMYKKLRETKGERRSSKFNQRSVKQNEKIIKNVSKNRTFMIEENEKIINIVDGILYFNQLNQPGQGLKILTTNPMFSRLPISLAQLKVENNSEKLKNEIRKLLYSFYRSKKLTKKLYKSLVDII